jgi:hypothetical protein
VSDYEWPQCDFLTANGRRIDNYLYEYFQSGLNTLGPYDIRHEPSPFWVSRAYNSMAVATTRRGQTAIDLEPFLYMTGLQDTPKPIAIDLITSPLEVAAAAERFVNFRLCASQDELRRSFKDPDRGRPAQIANGPLITTWLGRNLTRQTWGRIVPGTERLQLHLRAESDRPLADATIYDGTNIFRRYRCAGSRFCDVVINALHDRDHEFTAVVRDVSGRMAIRSGINTTDMVYRRLMCGDRQNSLCNGFTTDAMGNEIDIPAGFKQLKFMFRANGFPANPQIVDRVPWDWDGAPGGFVQGGVETLMWLPPLIPTQPRDTAPAVVSRMNFPLGSRDVTCQEINAEAIMPDHPFHEGGFWPMQPLRKYRAQTRCFEFRKTPDSSAAMLVEGSFTMLEDGQWSAHEWYWKRFSHIFYSLYGIPDASCNWALVNPGGETLSGAAPPRDQAANFITQLRPNGYIAYTTTHESGAVFALDEPIQVAQELNRDKWFRVWLGYNHLGKNYRDGDVIPFRFVIFTGSIGAPPNTREIEFFRKAFGLAGGEPAYTVVPRMGKVRSTNYVLELDSADGGFGGIIGKADLHQRLPIRVHGVNANWTCGIVERREKWWLPAGVLDGDAYVALDASADHDLWIGNVVLCDQPELILTLLPDGAGAFAVEAHNPTDREITATIRTATEFNLAPPLLLRKTVKPGTSEMIEIR